MKGEMQAFLRARLTPYQVPAEVRVLSELPRTASMKVDASVLRSQFAKPST
jgi:acyl-coenzyme A synthetase/AMP-(fatty) acid ligase